MKTLVGIRPTGRLHIGNYFSVIKPALEEGADVLIAGYHHDWREELDLFRQLAVFPISQGKIKFQTQTFGARRYFDLLNASRMGELERMPQYKSAKKKTPHLLIYPVLMAHDLVGYDRVIVGEDQKPHVEYANKLFDRLGIDRIEGDFRGGRIMSLTDPTSKMSKSEPEGCLFLDEDPTEKVMKAVTTKKGIENLSNLLERLGGGEWDVSDNEGSKRRLIEKIKEIKEE